jgi:hypothetical protein
MTELRRLEGPLLLSFAEIRQIIAAELEGHGRTADLHAVEL